MDTTNDSLKILRENSLVEPSIRNPFVHKLNLKLTDKLLLGATGIFLVPVRIVSITVIMLSAYFISLVITIGVSDEDLNEKPLTGWRKRLKGVIRFLGRSLAFCFGFHSIKKNGIRASRSDAAIFVAAPHSTFFDAFTFFILGLPTGVSRAENGQLPFLGRIVKAVQPILVNRENSRNKLYTIEQIKKRAKTDSDWSQLLVFPEGTTTNATCLITFKPGAFIPGLPVQPVVVEYKNRLDTMTWTWMGPNAIKCALLTLCQLNNKMEVTYLPIYNPNDEEKADAKLFAKNVRTKMAGYLNVSTTNHTYEDCRLMLKARQLNLPFESGLIEFDKLKEKLNINYENCEEMLHRFTEHSKKSKGKMTLKDFSTYLGLPPSGSVVQIFNMYDKDKDGYIDFREFVIGLSLLSRPINTEETLKQAFDMFDNEKKGYISLKDLQAILYSAFSMSPEEVEVLFKKIDSKNDGLITFDEFKSYTAQKPEYATIFSTFNEFRILRNNIEIEKLANMAKTTKSSDEKSIAPEKATASTNEKPTNDSGVVIKRPMSDKETKEKEKNHNLIVEDLTINENHLNKSGSSKENKNE